MKICSIAFNSIHTTRYIKWFLKNKHEVHWITCKPGDSIGGACIYDLSQHYIHVRFKGSSIFNRFRSFNRVSQYVYLLKLLKQIKPDILHLQTLYYPSFLGALTFFRPLVISPWNGDVLWTKKRPFYYKLFVKHSLRKADALTADNQIMKNGLLEYGVREEKISIIRWYGTDINLFKPMEKNIRLLQQLDIKDGLVVLSMRSLEKGYSIDKIIESIPLVLEKCKNVTYIFAWYGGSLENEMRSLVKDLQIENKIRFVGRIAYEDIPKYYSITDIAISIASPDSTPATLMEAMACGVPVIVSREKAITEFIKDSVNGEVVDHDKIEQIAEKTIKLLVNPNIRKLYGDRGRKLVMGTANGDIEMKKLERLYSQLIEERKK